MLLHPRSAPPRASEMSIDLLIKRAFHPTVCAMIACAAYFQATAMSSLLAEEWMRGGPPAPTSLPRFREGQPEPEPHVTSAASILARNPFDSVTGPLDRAPPPPESEAMPLVTDPYDDPECDTVRALLVVASDDPRWSFVALAAAGQPTRLRREGDEVAGRTVYAIAWDRVWLIEDGARCQARIGSKVAVPPPKARPPARRPGAAKPARGALPPAIASKIRAISEREFEVDRSVVDHVLENQADLMRSARVRPVKQDGKVAALQLLRVQPGSLLGTLGMKTGDRLRSINGFDLTDPQKALEAYARLRSASDLVIAVQRGGKDMTIDIHLR